MDESRISQFLLHREREGLQQFQYWIDRYFRFPSSGDRRGIDEQFRRAPMDLRNILLHHGQMITSSGLTHGKEEAQIARGMYRFADLPNDGEFFSLFDPEEIMSLLLQRAEILSNDVSQEGVSRVMLGLQRYIDGTYNRAEAERVISEVKKGIANRASNIVTTETTYFYNRARLTSFKEERVDYVQFSAILDLRTSTICKSRHGLIMAMNDRRLGHNVPPLHGRCRSLLRPIYSYVTPELITAERLNWDNADPLPKGWRTAT